MTPEITTSFHPAFVFLVLGCVVSLVVWWKKTFRRAAQVFFQTWFIGLFWLAAYSGKPLWPVDFFLASDPLITIVHSLAARVVVPLLLLSLVFVALATIMGRVYCSHICPLGSLFDLTDHFLAKKKNKAKANYNQFRKTRKVKYIVLLVLLAAALVGFDILGWADPLVILTRFAAVVFYPVLMALGDVGLDLIRPVALWNGWTELAYTQLYLPAFAGALGFVLLLVTLFGLAKLQRRFWCRHLCPLGGLFGVCGHWAAYKRQVNQDCTNCDNCTRKCPTGAIQPGGKEFDQHECIVCLECKHVCQENAVSFGFSQPETKPDNSPGLTRRGFVSSLSGGVFAGLAFRTDLSHPAATTRPRALPHKRLIRPPGARPERSFLTRCIRCGECMRACLTNTIQPDWYRAGLEGLWAPHLKLRHAHCEPSCNVCTQVCPTQALRPLDLLEKKHARIGTAVINREVCLAWAENRRCQVCDEICPYNAIYAKRDHEHTVALPVVETRRCIGCGTCEEACPIQAEAAIVVLPHGEIRLERGSYITEAKLRGYDFSGQGNLVDQVFEPPTLSQPTSTSPKTNKTKSDQQPKLPPGIDGQDTDLKSKLPDLPPGITAE